MTASARQRPQASATFAEANCRTAISQRRIRNSAVGQRPVFCSGEQQGGGGRNARATSRAKRVSGSSPRQFTLENCRLPLTLPQSFGPVRNSHVSLNTLSVTLLLAASQKPRPIVQKLWTSRLPCGRQRKS